MRLGFSHALGPALPPQWELRSSIVMDCVVEDAKKAGSSHNLKTSTRIDTMVLINLKTALGSSDDNNSNDEFLYETKLSTKVDDLIESLVNIHNARVRSRFIITTVKELAMYGVARRIDDGGDDGQKVRAASFFLYRIYSMTYRMPMMYSNRLTHHH